MQTKLATLLTDALKASGLRPAHIAKDTRVSEGMISRYLSGKSVPSDETLERLAEKLAGFANIDELKAVALAERLGEDAVSRLANRPVVKIDGGEQGGRVEIKQAKGINPTPPRPDSVSVVRMRAEPEVKMPFAGEVGCGRRIELDPTETVDVSPELAARGDFSVRARGESMTRARINDGDLLVIARDDAPGDGKLVLAQIADDGATIKRLRRSYSPHGVKTFLLAESHTEDHPPVLVDASVHIIGVVVYIQPAGFSV